MIRKIFLLILKMVLAIIAFLLLYLLAAFVLSKLTINKESSAPEEMDIYLLTNGIHSDIVVPTITDQINWFTKLNFLNPTQDISTYKYLAIGWGDKGFYLNTPSWSELKVSTALKATVGISGTAIHATYYEDMSAAEDCKKIRISKEQYSRLINYIENSFEKDATGQFIKIETTANRGDRDAFYEAKGRYHIFNTCNNWTNKGLKASGQKACLWTVIQKPIFQKYE